MIEFREPEFETAFYTAAANWSAWREDFNFGRDKDCGCKPCWKDRPLLNCGGRFSRFCKEYSLSRNIPGDPSETNGSKKKVEAAFKRRELVRTFIQQDEIPCCPESLADYFNEAKTDGSRFLEYVNQETEGLPKLPVMIPRAAGKDKKSQRVAASISMFSKIACFAYPETIVPIDSLNVKALNKRQNKPKVSNKKYVHFLKEFKTEHCRLWKKAAVSKLKFQRPTCVVGNFDIMNDFFEDLPEALCLRVTDHYLMTEGRRPG